MAHKDPQRRREYFKKYRLAHPEETKARQRAWYLAHLAQAKARGSEYDQALKADALRILGRACSCAGCGISEPKFLTIDHIQGRPKGRRKEAIKEARASGWDKTKFQILCANCNFAKSDSGFCPVHQTASAQSNGHSPKANAQQTFELLV